MDKLSYIPRKGAAIVRGTTIASLLDQRAKDTPNQTAHIIRNLTNTDPLQLSREVLTFADLAQNSLNLASSLLGLGIKPKDKIVVIGGCCVEYLYLEYACQRVSVLNIRLPATFVSPDVLVNVLKRYDARALVVESGDIEKRLSDILPGLFAGDDIGLDGLEHILSFSKADNKLHSRWKTLRELCEGCGTEQTSVRSIQDRQTSGDASVVIPTSGSTGTPKFVVHSHESYMQGVTMLVETCFKQHNPGFVYITDRPASALFGFTMLSVILGCVTVHLDASITFARRGVELYVDVVNAERATDSVCLAFLLYDLMCATREGIVQSASLQHVVTGAELIPRAIWEFAKSSFDTFVMVYGSTETLFNSRTPPSQRSANSTFEDFQWMEPRPEMEVKVTDDAGTLLPTGVVGNISVKSPFVMLGYLEDDAATSAAQSGGWFSTGDVGCINEDGLLKVVGRVKEVISKGTNKIYPVEVEMVIYRNPKVLKILAIAVPDERLYNEVCACVIPTPGAVITVEELRQFCEKQFISDVALGLPKYFMILEEYPKLSSGKFDKNTLRKMAISRFNLSEK